MRLINITANSGLKPAVVDSKALGLEIRPVDRSVSTIEVNHEFLQHSNPGKVLYSIKETSRILGISYEFVRSKVKAGQIQVKSFGSRKLIHISEVSRLISEGLPS